MNPSDLLASWTDTLRHPTQMLQRHLHAFCTGATGAAAAGLAGSQQEVAR